MEIALSEIQRSILRQYYYRHADKRSELLTGEEVADRLNESVDIVNDEIKKLEVMELLRVYEKFRYKYSAEITSLGLIVIMNITVTFNFSINCSSMNTKNVCYFIFRIIFF